MGADWLVNDLRIERVPSQLGVAVADLLGILFRGIYHMNYTSLRKAKWDNTNYIEITVDRELATWDADDLTRLVVLCHDRLLRCSVEGLAPGYLRLSFCQRDGRHGRTHERHPTIEESIERVRREDSESDFPDGAVEQMDQGGGEP